ncbi:MAG: sodium:solute symporter [Bacteroidia bacterium]
MNPTLSLTLIGIYFTILFIFSYLTGRKANEDSFFRANRSVPWYVVAYGMIGASISGVTFISVPGWVGAQQFAYMVMVVGYLLGYLVIAYVLMPLYYRLNLVSIYKYLEQRFGFWSYKSGAFYFLLSRLLGSAIRLYLAVMVLHEFVLGEMGVPFWVSVALAILMIWVFTFKGGMKTVIWTDLLQTTFLLAAAGLAVFFIAGELGMDSPGKVWNAVADSKYSNIFISDWAHPRHWVKQLLGGMFISMTMTGLDQDMMQKNLTCKTLKDAQKNMLSFSTVLVFVNLMFLALGVLLYLYGTTKGYVVEDFANKAAPLQYLDPATGTMIAGKTDRLFPFLTFTYLPTGVGVVFILGLFAAAYASADSALTALTTSFCIDFLNFENKTDQKAKNRTRLLVHVAMSVATFIVIMIASWINSVAVIEAVFQVATYTYGPLLGLFAFGLFTKLKVRDSLVPLICIVAPALCYFINFHFTTGWLGFMTLPVNGAFTFLGLLAISKGSQEVSFAKA